jgi:hypothetical protein
MLLVDKSTIQRRPSMTLMLSRPKIASRNASDGRRKTCEALRYLVIVIFSILEVDEELKRSSIAPRTQSHVNSELSVLCQRGCAVCAVDTLERTSILEDGPVKTRWSRPSGSNPGNWFKRSERHQLLRMRVNIDFAFLSLQRLFP